jgi:aldose 1-epimerase
MQTENSVQISQRLWQEQTHLFLLRNEFLEVELSDYGARLVRVKSPNRKGNREDVVLGFDTLTGYIGDTAYMGATIGRYANRIANGTFLLEGKTHQVKLPAGTIHALHGGKQGFDRRLWSSELLSDGVRMTLVSPDGDMGFPGTLTVSVNYRLLQDRLCIHFEASTDATTLLNLTNHAYFNLCGNDRGDILAHEITILADAFTPIDAEAIPTGEIETVLGTALDLRQPSIIGDHLIASDEQIRIGDGFNHNFALNGSGLRRVAELYEPLSGRALSVETTEPGLQFYTGNALAFAKGRYGRLYGPHSGLCLETQHFPDSPHHPQFPSTILRAGERFSSTTLYHFYTRD